MWNRSLSGVSLYENKQLEKKGKVKVILANLIKLLHLARYSTINIAILATECAFPRYQDSAPIPLYVYLHKMMLRFHSMHLGNWYKFAFCNMTKFGEYIGGELTLDMICF